MLRTQFHSILAGRTQHGRLSTTAFIRCLAIGAAVAFATLTFCQNASAEWVVLAGHYDEDTEQTSLIVEDTDNGSAWWLVFDKDDNILSVMYIGEDNPNPDSGTTTPGDRSSWTALLKQQGGGMSEPGVEKTPLGRYLLGKSKGIRPLHNPSGDSDSGPSASNGLDFKDPLDDALGVGEGHLGNPGGIDGNGGPIAGQLKDLLRNKGTGGGNDDGDSGARPADGGFWGPEMPGPPELVNPNPARSTRSAKNPGAISLMRARALRSTSRGSARATPSVGVRRIAR